MNEPICILATLDKNYIPYFNVMLSSLLDKNEGETFRVFLMNSSLTEENLTLSRKLIFGRGELVPVKTAENEFDGAPTSDRYPKECTTVFSRQSISLLMSTECCTLTQT